MGLHSLPADPLTVARYLAAPANSGASIATLRLATSAIAKAHEWAGHESLCKLGFAHSTCRFPCPRGLKSVKPSLVHDLQGNTRVDHHE